MTSLSQTPTYQQLSREQHYSQRQQHNLQRIRHTPSQHLDYPHDLALDFSAPAHLSPSHLDSLNAFVDCLPQDSMQSESWGSMAQFTPKMNRFPHHREPSLSSLGSTGPASPYTQHTSNPHIAITDSASDGVAEMHSHELAAAQGNPLYHIGKSMGPYSNFQHLDHGMPEMAYPVTIPGPNAKPRTDRGLLPAPDLASGSNRSLPASVASSVAGDSPATPTAGEPEQVGRRRQGYGTAPKLDRTMTDIYGDELYSPNFTITPTSPPQSHSVVSPNNNVFSQRINTANSQHLNAIHSPPSTTSRERSPFRTGSPFVASPSHDLGAVQGNSHFNSAQRMREQDKVQHEAQLLQQQMGQRTFPETPKTISPKDAMLEFHEPEGEHNFPLFPQGTDFEMDQLVTSCSKSSDGHPGTGAHLGYLPSPIPMGIQVPQQYPFVARAQANNEAMARLSSASSSSTGSAVELSPNRSRPKGSGAEGGTYTCTYHGCTLRFETPMLLQKHKREGHRQTQGLGAPRPQDMGLASPPSSLNTQAGPHRCDRINPSTGKPCSTVFSRPYDLTRHEDTIHNGRKQKVHCNLCTEEKTFSRADALTRHYRVCHPDVELPGKRRRRTGS